MATRFLDKESGADTVSNGVVSFVAIADDATGVAKVRNLPDAAGIVYDRADGFIKYNDAGNIRTLVNTDEAQTLTNKTVTSAVIAGDIGVPDDVSIELGTDDDSVLRHKSATNGANTALTDVIVGTPVTPALAANSLIVSNTTADGDVVLIGQTGGNSQAFLFNDSSANRLSLMAAGVEKAAITTEGFVNIVGAEVVTATNVITALESGKTFFLNAATEFVSTLPAPALGLNYTFYVTAAPSGASYTVVTAQAGSACEIMIGHVLTSGFADSGSDVELTAGGTTLTFVNSVSVIGDRAYFVSDGTNWYVSAICAVEAGITITG